MVDACRRLYHAPTAAPESRPYQWWLGCPRHPRERERRSGCDPSQGRATVSANAVRVAVIASVREPAIGRRQRRHQPEQVGHDAARDGAHVTALNLVGAAISWVRRSPSLTSGLCAPVIMLLQARALSRRADGIARPHRLTKMLVHILDEVAIREDMR